MLFYQRVVWVNSSINFSSTSGEVAEVFSSRSLHGEGQAPAVAWERPAVLYLHAEPGGTGFRDFYFSGSDISRVKKNESFKRRDQAGEPQASCSAICVDDGTFWWRERGLIQSWWQIQLQFAFQLRNCFLPCRKIKAWSIVPFVFFTVIAVILESQDWAVHICGNYEYSDCILQSPCWYKGQHWVTSSLGYFMYNTSALNPWY